MGRRSFGLDPHIDGRRERRRRRPRRRRRAPTRRSCGHTRTPRNLPRRTRYFAEGATSGILRDALGHRQPRPRARAAHAAASLPSGNGTEHLDVADRAAARRAASCRSARFAGLARGRVLDGARDRSARGRRSADVVEPPPTRYGAHARARRRRTRPDLVPRRGRDAQRLQPVLPPAEPQRRRGSGARALPAARPARRWRRPTRCRRTRARTSGSNVEDFPGLGQGAAPRPTSRPCSRCSTAQPIIVERALYLDPAGRRCSGRDTRVRASRRRPWSGSWPKAPPGAYFDLFVLIANPGERPTPRSRRRTCCRMAPVIVKTLHRRRQQPLQHLGRPRGRAAGRHGGVDDNPIHQRRAGDRRTGACGGRAATASGTKPTTRPARHPRGRSWALAEGEVGGRAVAWRRTSCWRTRPSRPASVQGHAPVRGRHQRAERTFDVTARSRFNVDVAHGVRGRAQQALRGHGRDRSAPRPRRLSSSGRCTGMRCGQHWAAGTNALATKLQ